MQTTKQTKKNMENLFRKGEIDNMPFYCFSDRHNQRTLRNKTFKFYVTKSISHLMLHILNEIVKSTFFVAFRRLIEWIITVDNSKSLSDLTFYCFYFFKLTLNVPENHLKSMWIVLVDSQLPHILRKLLVRAAKFAPKTNTIAQVMHLIDRF